MNLTKLKTKAGDLELAEKIRIAKAAPGTTAEKAAASMARWLEKCKTNGICPQCREPLPAERQGLFVTCDCRYRRGSVPTDLGHAMRVREGKCNGHTPVENAHDRRLRKKHNRRDPTGAKPKGVHAIAERRGTLCYVCGQSVDMCLAGTEPDGPTVEHIVPVKQWGPYRSARRSRTWAKCFPGVPMPRGFSPNHLENLAVSHSRCNTNNRPVEPHPNWVEEQKWRGTYPV